MNFLFFWFNKNGVINKINDQQASLLDLHCHRLRTCTNDKEGAYGQKGGFQNTPLKFLI